MEKECPECGEKLRGRTDKKFCSDYCRNTHHNKVNKETSNLIRNTNNLLRRNHRILEELNPGSKTSVPRNKLLAKGFNFEFFTSVYNTRSGNQYFFIYDQGYLKLENDFYALVKRN
ncbi:hypothetical protein [Christiangramia sabulilitoris]|uniref:DUF2116 family Zn-ribbon domain-containing protein n=1 Tax=Christiangramia sabulilitoris TaxID=2583991 RepID=A0A550I8B0_9FLAO|nr:hypothetical protein [Christiangramia sabulilitoris]TRO67215.1 hypothetical protein FGM01_04850 [Christiangramia sabulilitoris]